MIVSAILIILIGIYLLQNNGALTKQSTKKVASSLLLLLSAFLLIVEFGTMRGIFIFISLVSLLGTFFTLFLYKLKDT